MTRIQDFEIKESKEFLDQKNSVLVLVPSPQVTIKRDLERIADAFLEFKDTFTELDSAADVFRLRVALHEFLHAMQEPTETEPIIKAAEALEIVLLDLGVE